jgi:hypothetical protein
MNHKLDINLEPWWLSARDRVTASDIRKFDTLVILVAWSLWKHRNARVFGNIREQCGVRQLINRIKDELTSWESAHARGSIEYGLVVWEVECVGVCVCVCVCVIARS